MENKITIRNSVSLNDRQYLPEIMDRVLSFVKEKYPTVDFGKVDFIFSGSFSRGRYYRNEHENAKYKNPTVQIPTQRENELMYFKPSLGMYRNQVDNVGRFDVTASCIVHELTHHAQYELGKNHGELETTLNELEYYKKFSPDVYALFMNIKHEKKPVKVTKMIVAIEEVKPVEKIKVNSAAGKLEKLLASKKKWQSKSKRAETALKKIEKKIKYYSKKIV